ncbi:MAG: amino acid adenylation domain-containing protein [Pseudonocardiaceae bacterium]
MTRDIEDVYPLSPVQEGLLFHTLQAPGSGMYFQQMQLTLRGALNRTALRLAWQGVVNHHPVLRTAFAWQRREQPLQVVRAHADVPFAELDWRGIAPEEARAREVELRARDRERGFNLHVAPLMRLTLIQLADDLHRMVWSHHHIVLDGWSVALVLAEVARRYAAARRGATPAVEPVRPYREYVAWLRDHDVSVQEKYWRKTFEAYEPAQLDLLRSQTSAPAAHREGAAEVTLTPPEMTALESALRTHRLTLATALQGMWALLLCRYTYRTDVMFGVATAGRPADLSGATDMVGLFVNTLPLRLDIAADLPAAQWLAYVQGAATEFRAHEHVSLLQIQRWSGLETSTPLFDTAVVVENATRDASLWTRFADLTVSDVDFFVRTNFPIVLMAIPADTLRLRLVHDPERLDEATAGRTLRHVHTLLTQFATDPGLPLRALPMLTSRERDEIAAWNATTTPLSDLCLSELGLSELGLSDLGPIYRAIEDLAVVHGSAPALVHANRTVSYAELDGSANRLAHLLRRHGVDRDVIVGLCLDRSVELVTAMVATHKAGGAFCVVDPAYPPRRIATLIGDATPAVIVATPETVTALPETATPVLVLDSAELAAEPDSPPPVTPESDWLAYVVYTSGSTGRSMGVHIEHQALRNVIAAQQELWALTPQDAVLQCFPATVGPYILETFATLTCGARLYIAAATRLRPGAPLAETIAEYGVTALTLTPSALEALPSDATLPSVRTLSVIGERCSAALVTRFAPGRRFFNLYGSAEVAIVATATHCEPTTTDPTIGTPIANITCHVLAPDRQPVPVGIAGELCVGGIGLARGYLGCPDLTAERFVDTDAGRLYRTGDLVRRTANGELEFLGRLDHQVRVGGFRVEPAEVEAVLRSHPAVTSALAMAWKQGSERHLVAYTVLDRPAELQADDSDTNERVQIWQRGYHQTYLAADGDGYTELNTTRWRSSYTGDPIPEEQIRDWANATLARIIALAPRTALVIGCGDSMVLLPLAHAGVRVTGTHRVPATLTHLREQFTHPEYANAQVILREQAADDFAGLPEHHFDLVVLNSIIQYFPDRSYLSRVLAGAVRVLRPGGRIFVGDVRSLELCPALHLSVLLTTAPPDQPSQTVWATIRQRVDAEEELLVHADFFYRFAASLNAPCAVRILPKKGRFHNELTRFRYDVILTSGAVQGPLEEPPTYSWESVVADLQDHLARAPAALRVEAIPDGRTSGLVAAVAALTSSAPPRCLAETAVLIESAPGVNPETLLARAEDRGYLTELLMSATPGHLTAIFVRGDDPTAAQRLGHLADTTQIAPPALRPWRHCTNDPLRRRWQRAIIADLRSRLAASLPDYQMPRSLIAIAEFPLTPDGKIDRAALPEPDVTLRRTPQQAVSPRDSIELRIARIWSEALGEEEIDVTENFFHLGGHSLLAMRVTAALSREFGRELDPRTLFERPTVAQIARLLRDTTTAGSHGCAVSLQPNGHHAPFFCVHPASGNIIPYQPLAQALDESIPFWGLEEPDGGKPPSSVEELAAYYIKIIRAIQPEGAYRLGGWSFGGLVAYEMARQLAMTEMPVELVALFDSALPVPSSGEFTRLATARRFLRFTHYLTVIFGKSIPLTLDDLRSIDEMEQLEALVDACVAADVLSADTDPTLLRNLYAAYRRSITLALHYRPASYHGPVILYRASQPLPAQTRDETFDRADTALGWDGLCPSIEVVDVPGNHLTLLNPPQVTAIANHLGARLAIPISPAGCVVNSTPTTF